MKGVTATKRATATKRMMMGGDMYGSEAEMCPSSPPLVGNGALRIWEEDCQLGG